MSKAMNNDMLSFKVGFLTRLICAFDGMSMLIGRKERHPTL